MALNFIYHYLRQNSLGCLKPFLDFIRPPFVVHSVTLALGSDDLRRVSDCQNLIMRRISGVAEGLLWRNAGRRPTMPCFMFGFSETLTLS